MPAAVLTDLGSLCASVCAAASRFDASELERDDAVTALHGWSAIAHAAEAAAAIVAAQIKECGPPPSAGARDAADFVAKRTGTTAAKARSRIETGARLRTTKKTRAAATGGQLSPEQTEAIADAVAADPAAEEELLKSAKKKSLGELRDDCAK